MWDVCMPLSIWHGNAYHKDNFRLTCCRLNQVVEGVPTTCCHGHAAKSALLDHACVIFVLCLQLPILQIRQSPSSVASAAAKHIFTLL